jgi:predicted ATPase
MREDGENEIRAFEIRQDGPANEAGASKRGRPVTLPATEASRTALSTITTAEFPHLYALRDLFVNVRFLEINPQSARQPSDRFEAKVLKPDASNLAAVLARLKDETSTSERPEGVISDISADLSYLIPSVKSVQVFDSPLAREYAFGIETAEHIKFSSRVISDVTLRLLALLALLDDPSRRGILCFEEPENGVHEGRISLLIDLLRQSAAQLPISSSVPLFQILVNTHSPAVMFALHDDEIVASDSVTVVDPNTRQGIVKTRMRTGVNESGDLNLESDLTRAEVERLLRRQSAHA